MEVTKCFAAFIVIPKDLLCYPAQPEPTASDPMCSHILQSDMKKTVVNKITSGDFEKKCPFCKESQPESIIISLQGKFRNFYTDRDIGNIDDISTQRTLFSKIHFCDWIKHVIIAKSKYCDIRS